MTTSPISSLLDEFDIDALLITSATNRRYLTGFTATDVAPDRSSGMVIATRDQVSLYTSPTNRPWAQAEVSGAVSVGTISEDWPRALAQLGAEARRRIGFEDSTTTVAQYRAIEGLLAPGVQLVPVGGSLDARRAVKRPDEVALLEQALQMTDVAFGRATARLDEGITERAFAAIVDDEIRRAGADGVAFSTIVAAGSNAAKPHHAPGDHIIVEGEPIILDMGAQHRGYHGDLTRTLCLGRPDDRLVTMYRLVAQAQDAALAKIRSGASCRDVDFAVRHVFAMENMDANFVHGLGHGVGLRIHEAPWFNSSSADRLEENHVVTVEPGLYIAGWGGVRIEDVVRVTADGYENLTRAPKQSSWMQ